MLTGSLNSILTVILCVTLPASLLAECHNNYYDKLFTEVTASGGVWANLINARDSVRFQSFKLLEEAEKSLQSITPPDYSCPDECVLSETPGIVSMVTPLTFLKEDYPEKELCKRLKAATLESPITIDEKFFSSTEEFSSWFSEFSSGDGTDGVYLYEQCPCDCSIHYETLVQRENGRIKVNSSAKCGDARDKDSPDYRVRVNYRWHCVNG